MTRGVISKIRLGAILLGLSVCGAGAAEGGGDPFRVFTEASDSLFELQGPRIDFAEPVYDFGDVLAWQNVDHVFRFRNTGDLPMEIKNVSTSCGCTTTANKVATIDPGESGTIPIKVNTGRFHGPIRKTATVMSNAENQPRVVLTLHGTVRQALELSPKYVMLGVLKNPDKPKQGNFRITNHTKEPLKLKEVSSEDPHFDVEVKELKKGRVFELLVSTVPPLKAGAHNTTIRIKTNHEEKPELTVRAFAFSQPNIKKPETSQASKTPTP